MRLALDGPAAAWLDVARTAHVWSVSLAVSDATCSALRTSLSPEERARADRFAFERDRTAYVVSHAALRQILSRYAGREPAELRIAARPHGKPWLVDSPGIEFNLAHSGGFALIGVTRGAPIGVDVEVVRPIEDMARLARHCFAPAEVVELEALPPTARLESFFNAWTRKEAYIKAIGEGLSCPLESFEVTLVPGEAARLRRINGSAAEADRWSLHAFAPAAGVAAAVAIAGRGFELQHGWCMAACRALVATR
jgi:4'-phosphopantetheinyl transferase